ncbi:hypothetical protein [Pseudothauera lacus]|uniref:Uncharacterized protein n=1 Tax=Pseudothauera lacus TaxID=2136175 RepID=A0A2T4IFI7_9RHOO|nr:hypothetical protein [Pseudothauera lacus]PTD96535.1 hypothetical protein C8261_09560 [Pseudothauera lacus]
MNSTVTARPGCTMIATAILLQLFIAASSKAADQAPIPDAAEPAHGTSAGVLVPSSPRPAQTPSTDKPAYIPVLPPDLDLGLCDEG